MARDLGRAVASKVEMGCTAISVIYVAVGVAVLGSVLFFTKLTPMTPEKKVELRRIEIDDAYKQARKCEEQTDAVQKLSPDFFGKNYAAVRRGCWDDWRELQNRRDD